MGGMLNVMTEQHKAKVEVTSGTTERPAKINAQPKKRKDDHNRSGGARPPPSVFTAADLIAQIIPPVRWVLPGILPEGLTILAGKPKMGKSWLALDLAIAVATGGMVLGIQVERADVLYLALEDTKSRLQSRLKKLTWGITAQLDGLSLEIDWPPFGQHGLTHLEEWLGTHPAVGLVIIDTFARVRRKPKTNANVYADDYAAAHEVKALADKHRVAILLVHHLRKCGATDPVEEVSGSTGLTGAADGVLVLKRERGQADATLFTTGRDIDEEEIALNWDRESAKWRALGKADDYRLSLERDEIRRVLTEAREPMSPAEVAEALGKSHNSVKQLMWKMEKDGQIESTGSGRYIVNNFNNPIDSNNLSNSDNQATDRLPRLPVIQEQALRVVV